jgi:hypothetical protein
VTMPWSNQGISLIVIQAGTGFSGLFVYSGAPASGNLIASIAASAGTDPFGNAYPQGIMDQVPGGALQGVWNAASITLDKVSGVLAPPHITLSDGTASVTDGTVINSGGITTPLVTAVVPGDTAGTPETWHALTPAAGWSNAGGVQPDLAYRLTAQGDVELVGHISGTIAGTTLIATLPSGYFSTSISYTTPLVVSVSAGLTAAVTPRITMDGTTGQLSVKGLTNGAATIELDGITIPLSNG